MIKIHAALETQQAHIYNIHQEYIVCTSKGRSSWKFLLRLHSYTITPSRNMGWPVSLKIKNDLTGYNKFLNCEINITGYSPLYQCNFHWKLFMLRRS